MGKGYTTSSYYPTSIYYKTFSLVPYLKPNTDNFKKILKVCLQRPVLQMCKGTLQLAAYLTIVNYASRKG